jgi:hypothetical protein
MQLSRMNEDSSEASKPDTSVIAAPIDSAGRDALPGARSLLNYAPALILFLAVVADSMQYADADLWGHVRYGQIMLRTGHLIHADIFSYTAAGRRWIDHEWLSEIIMALVYNALGVAGLKLLKLLCAGAITTLLAAGLAETGASIAAQFVALAAVAIVLIQQMQFRPQLFDYVFLAALIAMLARESYGRRAPLWLTVPMLALWANLHGGFFVGLAALGVYCVARAAQGVAPGAGPGCAMRPAAITAAAALATLCNPWGSAEWTAVARSLGNPYTMGRISEFKPLLTMLAAMHRAGTISPTLVTMLLMLAALVAACLLAPRGDDVGLLAIAALMVAAAFAAARNTALAALALAVPLAYHADLAAARLGLGRRARTPAESQVPAAAQAAPRAAAASAAGAHAPRSMPLAFQAAVVLAALALPPGAGLLSGSLRAGLQCPAGAVAFMAAHGLGGNVLAEYSWGGYLIWHASAGRVFIDSRFEMVYPPRVQRDYLDFLRGGADAARVLAAYPTEYVLMPSDSVPARFMAAQPGWRLLYRDPVAELFARADLPAIRIAGVPLLRNQAPPSLFP